jgi:hypothetical protein
LVQLFDQGDKIVRPVGRLSTCGRYFKIAEVAQTFGLKLSMIEDMYQFWQKVCWGYVLDDFSPTHPVTLLASLLCRLNPFDNSLHLKVSDFSERKKNCAKLDRHFEICGKNFGAKTDRRFEICGKNFGAKIDRRFEICGEILARKSIEMANAL